MIEFTERKQNTRSYDRKIPFKKLIVFDDNSMIIK